MKAFHKKATKGFGQFSEYNRKCDGFLEIRNRLERPLEYLRIQHDMQIWVLVVY